MINSTLLWRDKLPQPAEPEMPLASIVVPVWNGEKMLQGCLNSILKQDLESFEIIIVDDGSTDRSLDIIKDTVGARAVRILKHSTNQGLSKTLNEGIKEAKGEFVQIVHQDCEIIDQDYVRRAIDSLRTNTEVAAITGRRTYELDRLSDNEKLFMVANGHLAEVSHGDQGIHDVTFTEHKCDLFRKSILESVGGFPDEKFRSSGEDQVLSRELRDQGFRLVRLGSIKYKLGFGNKESTLRGIFRKIFVYGKTQAGVLISNRRSSLKGISSSKALTGRAINRLQMLLFSVALFGGVALSAVSAYFLLVSVSAIIVRVLSYGSGLARIQGKMRLALVGPILDVVYSLGFLDGILLTGMRRQL